MADEVQIVATGARTPLGLQAPATAAAVRAAVSGLVEHPFMVDHLGDPVVGGFDPAIDREVMGPARFLGLAEGPLREACVPLAAVPTPRPRVPVYLALPAPRPGFSDRDAEVVREGLRAVGGLPAGLGEVKAFPAGHAAGFAAFAAAVEQLRRGAAEACLVGGVESYYQPETLEWLEQTRQLAGADTRSAFPPGEGAGFCLLMSEQARRRARADVGLRVRSVALGRETKLIKTEDVCLGEGLTATIREAVRGLHPPGERVNDIICDINGERYRGEEWGFVCLRLAEYFDDPTGYQSPTDCWGDMGAASAPLFAMIAHRAVRRGQSRPRRTLLWAGSEAGLRGAAVLEPVGPT